MPKKRKEPKGRKKKRGHDPGDTANDEAEDENFEEVMAVFDIDEPNAFVSVRLTTESAERDRAEIVRAVTEVVDSVETIEVAFDVVDGHVEVYIEPEKLVQLDLLVNSIGFWRVVDAREAKTAAVLSAVEGALSEPVGPQTARAAPPLPCCIRLDVCSVAPQGNWPSWMSTTTPSARPRMTLSPRPRPRRRLSGSPRSTYQARTSRLSSLRGISGSIRPRSTSSCGWPRRRWWQSW